MHKDKAELWVDALRSGKYPQTTARLECSPERYERRKSTPVGFCCLGVLCILAVEAGVISRDIDEYGIVRFGEGPDVHSGDLPDAVVEWAGMKSSDGVRNNEAYFKEDTDEYRACLTTLNDSEGYTFEQLANVIEAEYADL